MVEPKQMVIALKTKLETSRRRAEAAEVRNAELERLNQEKGEMLRQLEERLSLTRSSSIILKHLVPVLRKLRDTEIKLQQQTAHGDEMEAKRDALNAQIEQLQDKFDAVRKERKELTDLLAELFI